MDPRRKGRRLVVSLLGAGFVAVTSPALSQDHEGGGRPDGRRGPPPEALEACEGREQDASCTFATPWGDELVGVCDTRRDELVCVPDGAPGGEGRGGRARSDAAR